MDEHEYISHDALGLAELVRRGETTSSELLEVAVRRAERLNPRLNAIVTPMYDEGRRIVDRGVDGPFAGVPLLLKDLLHAYAGFPLSSGSAALCEWKPPLDSTFVRRLRRAGLVVFGKTNTPELGIVAVTEPEVFGPCRNPWNLDHTPGGSSGGSAAAVAAGITPIAAANDGGGSIRIPAACCGLFGLKPSRGRVPTGPYFGEVWDGAVVDHVLTRSVRDSAGALDATRGFEAGAPYGIMEPERPYLEEVDRPVERLRVAFSTRSPIGTPVHPDCVQAVHSAARLLEELGHEVVEAEPSIDGRAVIRSYLTMYYGEVAADLEMARSLVGGRKVRRGFEERTKMLAAIGRILPAATFVEAKRSWNTFAREMGRFHRRHDIYLTPALARPPVRVGEVAPGVAEKLGMKLARALRAGRLLLAAGIIDRIAEENLALVPFTQLANLTGQPGMSVPLHWSAEGLPCGVQCMAAFGSEDLLIRLAAQLEEARPWFHRLPPLATASM